MRVLIDTNIVLDFIQERQPFIKDAVRLFERVDTGEIEGFIAAAHAKTKHLLTGIEVGFPSQKPDTPTQFLPFPPALAPQLPKQSTVEETVLTSPPLDPFS